MPTTRNEFERCGAQTHSARKSVREYVIYLAIKISRSWRTEYLILLLGVCCVKGLHAFLHACHPPPKSTRPTNRPARGKGKMCVCVCLNVRVYIFHILHTKHALRTHQPHARTKLRVKVLRIRHGNHLFAGQAHCVSRWFRGACFCSG